MSMSKRIPLATGSCRSPITTDLGEEKEFPQPHESERGKREGFILNETDFSTNI